MYASDLRLLRTSTTTHQWQYPN